MGSYIKLCIYMPSLKILRNVYLTVNLYLKILACNRVLFFVFFFNDNIHAKTVFCFYLDVLFLVLALLGESYLGIPQ